MVGSESPGDTGATGGHTDVLAGPVAAAGAAGVVNVSARQITVQSIDDVLMEI